MNRWLAFWYDGDNKRVTVIDFGSDIGNGPFGNDGMIIDKLNEVIAPHARSADISLNALVRLHDETLDVIMEDREITDIAVVEIPPR